MDYANWTTIATIAITDDTAAEVITDIIGIKADASQRALYQLVGLVYRASAGAATAQGSARLVEVESDANWDAQISVSGNNVLIQVKGAAGTSVKWEAVTKSRQILKTLSA